MHDANINLETTIIIGIIIVRITIITITTICVRPLPPPVSSSRFVSSDRFLGWGAAPTLRSVVPCDRFI